MQTSCWLLIHQPADKNLYQRLLFWWSCAIQPLNSLICIFFVVSAQRPLVAEAEFKYWPQESIRDSQETLHMWINGGRTTMVKLRGISRFPHASWSVSFPRKETRLMGFPHLNLTKRDKEWKGEWEEGRHNTYLWLVHVYKSECVAMCITSHACKCKFVHVLVTHVQTGPCLPTTHEPRSRQYIAGQSATKNSHCWSKLYKPYKKKKKSFISLSFLSSAEREPKFTSICCCSDIITWNQWAGRVM